MGARWEPGSPALIQEVWQGRAFSVRPTYVAADEDECLALWAPPGTAVRGPTPPPWRPAAASKIERFIANLQGCDWEYMDRVWEISLLFLIRPDRWHSTWLAWDKDDRFLWGYVNFQMPARRGPRRVQTMDLALDLVLEPGGNVTVKDEDHFLRLQQVGLIDAEVAVRIESERRVVLKEIEAGSLYAQRWLSWKPDERFPSDPPSLPEDWADTRLRNEPHQT